MVNKKDLYHSFICDKSLAISLNTDVSPHRSDDFKPGKNTVPLLPFIGFIVSLFVQLSRMNLPKITGGCAYFYAYSQHKKRFTEPAYLSNKYSLPVSSSTNLTLLASSMSLRAKLALII